MQIYVRHKNNQLGPFTDEEVAKRLRDGSYLPNDLGCREGMTEWQSLATLFPLDLPPLLKLEHLKSNLEFKDGSEAFNIYRAKIPGRWLVLMQNRDYSIGGTSGYGWGYGGATFVPDPDHVWDGSSLN